MLSTSSNPKLQPSLWSFDAIGTYWLIETDTALSSQIKDGITKCIEDFDVAYSRFRADSMVSRVAQTAGTYSFPDDSSELMRIYEQLYVATDGAMTPLVGDTLRTMGYDKDYSLQPGIVAPVKDWHMVMRWDKAIVTTEEPITLDFGAVGKGYLVDKLAAILEKNDIVTYIIDASGDIRQRGDNRQKIGLEDPRDSSRVIGVADLQNASLCASVSNRRRWGNGLHHVIDGRTGKPTNSIIATWVITDTTALADGLATALFFVDDNQLRSLGEFQFVRLRYDGQVEHSRDFVGQLFI